MDLNEKLLSLFKFINEGKRRKIYYIKYFEFILHTFINLIENRIFNVESFKRFILSTKQPVYNEFLINDDFRSRLEEFLIENPEINKIIEKTNMDYSIIITNLRYQFEFLDKCDNPEYNIEGCEDPLNKSIKGLRAEIKELINFQIFLQKEIEKLELCYICNDQTLNVCIECGKCICEKHSTVDHCPDCTVMILKEKRKES